jgi:hypothetical protein
MYRSHVPDGDCSNMLGSWNRVETMLIAVDPVRRVVSIRWTIIIPNKPMTTTARSSAIVWLPREWRMTLW